MSKLTLIPVQTSDGKCVGYAKLLETSGLTRRLEIEIESRELNGLATFSGCDFSVGDGFITLVNNRPK